MNAPSDADQPWRRLPPVNLPVQLERGRTNIDDLFELPAGSAVTFARLDESGQLTAVCWRSSGEQPFYPASTIKWVTAVLTLQVMRRYAIALDDVVEIVGEKPLSVRDLLGSMLVHSDNHAFNILQELAGFGETYDQMQGWGCRRSILRRHFTQPHYSHSREMTIHRQGCSRPLSLASRDEPKLPLNDDDRPPPLGNKEQNLATTDDLVRIAAATLAGPDRDLPHLERMAHHLLVSQGSDVRRGLQTLTARDPGRPAFVVLSKPGWWPADGANAEMAYIYDVRRGSHYFLAAYVQGSRSRGRTCLRRLAQRLLAASPRLEP